jgi:hypothetical protein
LLITAGMRHFALLASFALAAAAGCVASDDSTINDASLRVTNQSDFAISEIYLTDVGSRDWGPNLLRGDVLLPGEDLVLGVDCGRYDALLVDETGVDCEIDNVDLCLNDADWVIRNNTCTVFGANKK